jgi:GTP cyclohydrolase II
VHKPDLTDTSPAVDIGPYPSWFDVKKIVSLDPFGHLVAHAFKDHLSLGYDIRPSIAVTKAHIHIPELEEAFAKGRLTPDGKVLLENHSAVVTKVAVDPVWYLPGIAERFHCEEQDLRRILFEKTAGMYPELVTRTDLSVFLPPIGGTTVYLFGDVGTIPDESKPLNVRVHDECNGSDVFGSDICTCRPYLVHGIELCIQSAQAGGAGVIVYNRKEGRALGEVTKFLVYNARKRQKGGDRADKYFERTECVAGVQDMRFQELMPDVLLWLGIQTINKMASMSNMKLDALKACGIKVKEQVSIPEDMISAEAHVEMDAKKAAGYFSLGDKPTAEDLAQTKGRPL